jgi:hypothetical protein
VTPVGYRLDAADVIVAVDEGWRGFARANDASELADAVVGRRIWDYVTGAETAHLWNEVFARARRAGPVELPYRCDSPSLRRYLRMRITAGADGSLELASTIEREEPREPPEWFVPGARRVDVTVTGCSWCRRYAVGGDWVEVEDAVAALDLFAGEAPAITHGLCPACATAVRAELRS